MTPSIVVSDTGTGAKEDNNDCSPSSPIPPSDDDDETLSDIQDRLETYHTTSSDNPAKDIEEETATLPIDLINTNTGAKESNHYRSSSSPLTRPSSNDGGNLNDSKHIREAEKTHTGAKEDNDCRSSSSSPTPSSNDDGISVDSKSLPSKQEHDLNVSDGVLTEEALVSLDKTDIDSYSPQKHITLKGDGDEEVVNLAGDKNQRSDLSEIKMENAGVFNTRSDSSEGKEDFDRIIDEIFEDESLDSPGQKEVLKENEYKTDERSKNDNNRSFYDKNATHSIASSSTLSSKSVRDNHYSRKDVSRSVPMASARIPSAIYSPPNPPKRSFISNNDSTGNRLYVQGIEAERKRALYLKQISEKERSSQKLKLATRSYEMKARSKSTQRALRKEEHNRSLQSVHDRLYGMAKSKRNSSSSSVSVGVSIPSDTYQPNSGDVYNRLYRISQERKHDTLEKKEGKHSYKSHQGISTNERLYNLAKKKRLLEMEREKRRAEKEKLKDIPVKMKLATKSYVPLVPRASSSIGGGSIHDRLYELSKQRPISRGIPREDDFNCGNSISSSRSKYLSSSEKKAVTNRLYGRSMKVQEEGRQRRESIEKAHAPRAPTPSRRIHIEKATEIYDRGMVQKACLEIKREESSIDPYTSPLLSPPSVSRSSTPLGMRSRSFSPAPMRMRSISPGPRKLSRWSTPTKPRSQSTLPWQSSDRSKSTTKPQRGKSRSRLPKDRIRSQTPTERLVRQIDSKDPQQLSKKDIEFYTKLKNWENAKGSSNSNFEVPRQQMGHSFFDDEKQKIKGSQLPPTGEWKRHANPDPELFKSDRTADTDDETLSLSIARQQAPYLIQARSQEYQ